MAHDNAIKELSDDEQKEQEEKIRNMQAQREEIERLKKELQEKEILLKKEETKDHPYLPGIFPESKMR